jgi:type 1 glutamine amidotransferase
MKQGAIRFGVLGCLMGMGCLIVLGGLLAAAEPKAKDQRPQVVFVIYEDEYKADQTLPAFARVLGDHGYRSTVLLGGEKGIEGLEALKTADVMVLFARRKALPTEQLAAIRAYLDAGKPLVALRTACHAFTLRARTQAPEGSSQWPTFDVDVLGCHYANHLGNEEGTDVANVPEAAADPLLAGVEPAKWHSTGSLYKVLPLEPGCKVLMTGSLGDHSEPVTWTRTYHGGRVFSTTLGHADDFALPQFQKLLLNAIGWATGK